MVGTHVGLSRWKSFIEGSKPRPLGLNSRPEVRGEIKKPDMEYLRKENLFPERGNRRCSDAHLAHFCPL